MILVKAVLSVQKYTIFPEKIILQSRFFLYIWDFIIYGCQMIYLKKVYITVHLVIMKIK